MVGEIDKSREKAARRTDHTARLDASRARLISSRKLCLSTEVIIRETHVTIGRTLEKLGGAECQTGPTEPIGLSPQDAAIKSTEDPVLQARRRVAEAEGHIERQEALIARLSDSNKYVALAGASRKVLATLKETLRLARDQLALELKK